jgi:hypothetical protein
LNFCIVIISKYSVIVFVIFHFFVYVVKSFLQSADLFSMMWQTVYKHTC